MNRFGRAHWLCAAVLMVFPMGAPLAQETEEETGGYTIFEEIVVTARKREETAQSVPIPITALNEETMESRNVIEIQDLEKLSPNTSIQYSAVNGTASEVFLRGIGQVNWAATQDPKIGIYVDGVYLSRPQGGLFDLWDIERVEILRGPQGTLFGRNTTAGLIHVVNKRPGFERELDVHVGAGSDSHRTLGLVVNQPLSDRIAFRFAAYDKETDGFIENRLTGNDRANENSTTYRASAIMELDRLTAQITYNRFDSDERGPLGSCRFTGPDNPIDATGLPQLAGIFGIYGQLQTSCRSTDRDQSIDTAPDETARSEVDAYSLHLTYDLDWAEINSITAHREIDNFNGTWGWVMGNSPGSNFLEVLNNTSENEVFSQELRLSGFTDRLDWVVGIYMFEEESDESVDVPLFRDVEPPDRRDWPIFYFPTGNRNPDGSRQIVGDLALLAQVFSSRHQAYDVTNKNRAIFGEITYQISENLDFTFGVRYTEDDREFTRIQTLYGGGFDPTYMCPGMPTTEVAPGVFAAASDRCTQEVSYDETTPRGILSYALSDDVMLYTSYSVGYSSGGFNQDVRMRPYLPEISDNWEVGFKSFLFDGRVRLNATAFHNNYENQQLTVGRLVNGQPTADLINAQEAVIWGIEAELLAGLTERLSLALALGHLDGGYEEFTVEDEDFDVITLQRVTSVRDLSDVGFGSPDGKRLTADISFQHRWPLSGGGEISSSIGFSYSDDLWYSLENIPSSKADGYWLSDLRITWYLANDRTRISLWGNNLFDEDYVNTMLNQAGDVEVGGINSGLAMSTDYWGEPRRWGVEFKHSF